MDAAADQPQDTGAELHVTHGKGGNTVIFNPKTGQDSFEINLTAKFLMIMRMVPKQYYIHSSPASIFHPLTMANYRMD